MKIRAYQNTDKEAVIKLWQECELIAPQNDPVKDIARKMSVNRDLFLVGEIKGKIIASVMGGYEGHRGWINYLAVKPSEQRRGYGQKIMQAVESLIQDKGCPKINLQVRTSNTEVISFYRALGYGDDKVVGLGKRLEQD